MSIKVLVADDSITIQKVIGIIFGGDEYSLTVVDNGKAAVDKAREITPDILLIDALMPGMTGYEVAEAVRATPSLANKPILILTGSFEPFDEEKAKKCGADDFIAKPFESQQIISKVKELLELGSSKVPSAPTPSPEPVVEVASAEQTFEAPPAAQIIPVPVVSQQPEEIQPAAAPSDIWGAFTPEADATADVETAAVPSVATPTPEISEPDVFAIVSEENNSQLVQNETPAHVSPQHTGSQWVPVEENTFEFEEEVIAEPPPTTFIDQVAPIQEASFGDIAFEEETVVSSASAFDSAPEQEFTVPEPAFSTPAPDFADFAAPEPIFEAPAAPAAPFAPLADPTPAFVAPVEAHSAAPSASAISPSATTAIPPVLTEEQLRSALASVSKDVIERIVWEVVPDLAEALICEAIRKIKAGI